MQRVTWCAHGVAATTANLDMAMLKNATYLPLSALWMTVKSHLSLAEQITLPLARIQPKLSTAGAGNGLYFSIKINHVMNDNFV